MSSRLEKQIQRDIEVALGSEPDLLLIKNSVGAARFVDDDGKEFHVPYGLGTGSPDLVGLLRVGARATWFCLEVKAPGGRVDPAQAKCHDIWRRFGAFVEVVRSVDDARAALAAARTGGTP